MVVWYRSASLSWLANFVFQSSYACLCFQEVLWPEFSIWNFFSAILSYQRNCDAIQVSTSCLCSSLERFHCDIASCISRLPEITILKREDNCRLRQTGSVFLTSWSVEEQTPLHPLPPSDVEQKVKDYEAARERRVERFLEHVKMKHRTFLERACPAEC